MRLITLLLMLFISSVAYADIGGIMQIQGKSVTLYVEPAANAKTVANLTVGQQVIPIYAQGDWVKVANPANGAIGWIKKTDLQQAAPVLSSQAVMQSYVITQQGKDAKKVYQIDNKGDVQALKGEQAQAVIQQMDQQQKQMQEQMNKMMYNAWQNFLMTQNLFNKLNHQAEWQMPNITTPPQAHNK